MTFAASLALFLAVFALVFVLMQRAFALLTVQPETAASAEKQ